MLALAGCTPMGPGSSQTPDITQSLEDRDDSATCIRDGERFLFQRFRWSLAAILLSMVQVTLGRDLSRPEEGLSVN